MKLKLALAAAAMTAGVAHAHDHTYNAEVGLMASQVDTGFSDSNAFGIGGELLFAPAMTNKGPLEEAKFLSMVGGASAAYATNDDTDVDSIGLAVDGYMGSVYAAARYSQLDAGAVDVDSYGVSVGYRVSPALLVALDYDDSDDLNISSVGVSAKYLAQLGGEQALNIEGGVTSFDDAADSKVFSLSGDYYLNAMFSVGVGIEESDQSGVDTAFSFNTNYFVTKKVSVGAEYATQDPVDAITLMAAMRF